MLKKFKCTKCSESFEKEFPPSHNKIKVVKGKVVDFHTGEPIPEDINPDCSCGGKTIQILNGIPAARFQVADLDFAINRKRMTEGLYNDMSHKSATKAKELKEEMQHNGKQVV